MSLLEKEPGRLVLGGYDRSHISVLVISDNVEEQLAPYDGSIEAVPIG
jgi:hypothetical protein